MSPFEIEGKGEMVSTAAHMSTWTRCQDWRNTSGAGNPRPVDYYSGKTEPDPPTPAPQYTRALVLCRVTIFNKTPFWLVTGLFILAQVWWTRLRESRLALIRLTPSVHYKIIYLPRVCCYPRIEGTRTLSPISLWSVANSIFHSNPIPSDSESDPSEPRGEYWSNYVNDGTQVAEFQNPQLFSAKNLFSSLF